MSQPVSAPVPSHQQIALIGAGPSGLAGARNLQKLGIPFQGFEAYDDVGGLWNIGNPRSTVYQSAHLISSKRTTEFAEFPMADSVAAMLKPHAHRPELLAEVEAAWRAPSLYDEALRLLARRGLDVPADHLERDWSKPYEASDGVEQAWLVAYREPKKHWELYQLGEELTDLEDAFRLWRFRHVTTVERVIGFKRGTGGTGGVSYLRKMLDVVLFPEIWKLRTDL